MDFSRVLLSIFYKKSIKLIESSVSGFQSGTIFPFFSTCCKNKMVFLVRSIDRTKRVTTPLTNVKLLLKCLFVYILHKSHVFLVYEIFRWRVERRPVWCRLKLAWMTLVFTKHFLGGVLICSSDLGGMYWTSLEVLLLWGRSWQKVCIPRKGN